jgi:RNA polymerase sigma-32 factor
MLTLAERTAHTLSPEETTELAREYRRTGDARLVARIVEGNLRLAWRYLARFRRFDAQDDLRQQAYMALFEAARRFDPEEGVRFSTYAWYWLSAQVLGYVVENHAAMATGRSPPVSKVFFGLSRVIGKLDAAGVPSTDENVAGVLNVDPGIVRDIRRARHTVSLDAPYGKESLSLVENIPGEAEDPTAAIELREFTERLEQLLTSLTERERSIIEHRYQWGHTLAQIGKWLGLTNEGVRKVEIRALAKLRAGLSRERHAAAAA